jgi:CRISPR system Cascade subunit CasA
MNFQPSEEPAFSLIREPWIKTIDLDGSKKTRSLHDVFEDINSIKTLSGDNVTQDVSILRILLAIVYDALNPVLTDDWKKWFTENTLPKERILAYLDDHYDEFYLFHPTHPFMQQFDARPANPDANTDSSGLILKPIGNEELFADKRGAGINALSIDEAARWMLSIVQYGTSGPKTDYYGDPYGVKGRSYTTKPLLACMSTVWLSTGSLLKDLLMALVPIDSKFMVTMSDESFDESLDEEEDDEYTAGTPAWRKPQLLPSDGDKSKKQRPESILDALTWRGRRVRLFLDEDGEHVSHAFVAMGLPVELDECMGIEPMALWKLVKEDKKTNAPEHHTSIQYSTEKALWRGLSPMLAADGDKSGNIGAMTLRWAAQLNSKGLIPDSYLANIRVVTVRYDTAYSARITEILDDTVHIPIRVLNNPVNAQKISDAVSMSEAVAKAYGLFVWRCRGAMGEDDRTASGSRDKERSSAYADMESFFYHWLVSLDDHEDALHEWFSIIFTLISRKADKYSASLPLSAVSGRNSFSSIQARNKLRIDLVKIGKDMA